MTFPGSLSLAFFFVIFHSLGQTFRMFFSLLIFLSVLFLQSRMPVFVPQVTQDDTTLHLCCFGPGLLPITAGGVLTAYCWILNFRATEERLDSASSLGTAAKERWCVSAPPAPTPHNNRLIPNANANRLASHFSLVCSCDSQPFTQFLPVVVTPNRKIVSLLLHDCNFATVSDYNIS